MSIEIKINADEFIKYMKNVKIACDNLEKALAEYYTKNWHKIIKEMIKEHNKRMRVKE